MRQIGIIDPPLAERFADYLLTLGITSKLEPLPTGVAVWVRNEEQVAHAQTELATFLAGPDDARYASAATEAAALRQAKAQREKRAAKNIVEVREVWDRRQVVGGRSLTAVLVAISVAVAIYSNFGADRIKLVQAKLFISSIDPAGGNYLPEVRQGQVWRLITPIFIHLSLTHLLFNMLMLFRLGALIEGYKGAPKLFGMVLLIAVSSNLGQYFFGHSIAFGGMSGVVYGLFGYLWMKGRFQPQEGLGVDPSTVFLMIAWFVLCAAGYIGSIANWAHGVGLGVGMALGVLPWLLRRSGIR